ncbi:MAG: glycerol-3-phosphate 1-O-acyltransferase PlsY [Magnetococcales bacterium]|nr:glycerol-3-phosphate 1-O-acyltransferase PlsY [Magnetococcales bacterium]
MSETVLITALLLSYLLGAVPFGLILARLNGVGDIRQQGSGNIGATNVLRTAGRTAAALTLLLDMAKGALPVGLACRYFGDNDPATAGVALAVLVGHIFPVYLKFRGGKGVATGLGIFLAWTPWVGLEAVALWLITTRLTKISSIGAVVSFAALPLLLYWQKADQPWSWMTALFITLLVIQRHRGNLRRMMDGSEPRLGQN